METGHQSPQRGHKQVSVEPDLIGESDPAGSKSQGVGGGEQCGQSGGWGWGRQLLRALRILKSAQMATRSLPSGAGQGKRTEKLSDRCSQRIRFHLPHLAAKMPYSRDASCERSIRPGSVGREGPGAEDTCPFSQSPLSQPPATAGLSSARHTLRAQPWASHLWVRRVSRAGEYSTAVKKDQQLCLNG